MLNTNPDNRAAAIVSLFLRKLGFFSYYSFASSFSSLSFLRFVTYWPSISDFDESLSYSCFELADKYFR